MTDRALVEFLRARYDEAERMEFQQRDLVTFLGWANRMIVEAEADGIPADHPSSVYRDALLDRVTWHVAASRRARERRGLPPVSDDDVANGAALADIEAKRRILDEHGPYECGGTFYCASCGDVPQVLFPCDTVRLLGMAESAHPDYREEWTPA